jgi:hypothetical protein
VGETDLDETFYTAANMCGISLNSDGLWTLNRIKKVGHISDNYHE